MPKTAMATAIASSKLFLAAVKASVVLLDYFSGAYLNQAGAVGRVRAAEAAQVGGSLARSPVSPNSAVAGGRVTTELVDEEIARLSKQWQPCVDGIKASNLAELVDLKLLDEFDRVQLEAVVLDAF
jgi:sigma54-dependent transcription regulator